MAICCDFECPEYFELQVSGLHEAEVTDQEMERLVRLTLQRATRDMRLAAHHEAAHAVVARVRRIHVEEVHIEEDVVEGFQGKCFMACPSDLLRLRDDYLPAVLAGGEIERGRFHVDTDTVNASCESDYAVADDVIEKLWHHTHDVPWDSYERSCLNFYWDCFEAAQKVARQVIREHSTAIRQVAASLIAVTYLVDDDVDVIIHQQDQPFMARRLSKHLATVKEAHKNHRA